MKFEIVFIDDLIGKRIVGKFLDSCSDSLTTKILRQLQYLEEFGISHENPSLKKLTETSFWEIRILGSQNVRIFCTKYLKSQIIIVYMFAKKTTKTPKQDISKAERLLRLVLDK